MSTSSRRSFRVERSHGRHRDQGRGGGGLRLGRLAALVVALAAACFIPVASAQDAPIPERFATTSSDTDYPGGDLTPLFNVSLEQCHGTCLRLEDCAGFTFNQRNGACFPKAVLADPVAFEGALSGVITRRDEVALERAREVAARLDFLESDDVGAAREQAISMAERYAAGGRSQAELMEAARRAPSEAVTWTGAAVTVADDGAAWLAHARALVAEAGRDANRRYELDRQAVSAALNAVLRLPEPERAQALVVLAHALEETYRGEAALGALRLADGMRPGIAAGDLARLRERFGFRVLGHDVDASSAAPRICVSFSEQLSPRRDYAPFVGRDVQGLALEVEGQELCVTGVAYGESYRLTLRAGLPSAGGDALTGDVPVEVYVRDRAPVGAFPGPRLRLARLRAARASDRDGERRPAGAAAAAGVGPQPRHRRPRR
ncbi:MAG: PAN domain-containing protein [Trueperaceae bacterium]|nr:PAN domain-containing protein [Trueperaceae bacterium]